MQSRDDIAEQVVALAGSVSNEKAAKMRALVADARLDGAKSRVDLIEARCHGLIAAHEVALNLSKAISDIQDRDMARIADLERGASILRAEDAGILERLARAETTIKAAWDNDAKGHRWNEERISALEKRLADFERATTNTGEGASTRKGDDGTLTGQPTVSTPSPAPSASEIHAWVPSETELEALWRTHPVGGEFAAMRRLIASRAPRASAVGVEALAHAREALRQLLPCGHDGDEDSGQCDPDCDKCACEGAIAHIDAALSALPASEAPQPLACPHCSKPLPPYSLIRERAAQPAPASTPDEGEVYAAFVKLYVAACVAANSDGWDVPQVCHPMWTVLAKAALSLSSSRTPRVDAEFVEVADCLRDRFDLLYRMNGAFNPRDAKETAHDEECLADYDRVREGVECVGEKESAS